MTFELTILGSNSAIPAHQRHPSAQVLDVSENSYLIDCGEGTQMRMQTFQVRSGRIRQIFISHLHGDHIFGLIGLLTSYSLGGRTEPLQVFSPPGLRQVIEVQLAASQTQLKYELKFIELDTTLSQVIFEDARVSVTTIPLEHRIPTTGYLFREHPRLPNMRSEAIEEFQIPYQDIPAIKAGGDFRTTDGRVIPHQELVLPAAPPRSFAYCSDTVYLERLIPLLTGVDLLYHETTFMDELAEQAALTKHTTVRQAAHLAQAAGVGCLVMGHYSSRYRDLRPLLDEARAVFPASELGQEGRTYAVPLKRQV